MLNQAVGAGEAFDSDPAFWILTAQTLNSGIFAMESKAGLVNMFAALSTKWDNMAKILSGKLFYAPLEKFDRASIFSVIFML